MSGLPQAKAATVPPVPPVGDHSEKWLRHCRKDWKKVVSATLVRRTSPNQKTPVRIKDYSVRTQIDNADLKPGMDAHGLAAEAYQDAVRNCESGPCQAYYGLQLWGWDDGEHIDLGLVWEHVDIANVGGGGDQTMAIVGVLRGIVIEQRDSYNDLSKQNEGNIKAMGELLKASVDAMKEIPVMMSGLAQQMTELQEKNSKTVTDFYEARQKEKMWEQGWSTLRWGIATGVAYSVAKSEQKAGRPANFDPQNIKDVADTMADPGGKARAMALDLAITDEQRTKFIEILGADVVEAMDELAKMAGDSTADISSLMMKVAAIKTGVTGEKFTRLLPYLNEKQIAALALMQKMTGGM